MHHKDRKFLGIFNARNLFISIIIGSVVALIVGLVLNYFAISINVILPVLAPIWVGSITLSYTALNQMH
ncbi:MAG: hypothetical protein ABID38_05425 [Candidatus Diapherotrites archaeon]